MKFELIEQQKLITELRALRADLDEETTTKKVQEFASAHAVSTLDNLRYCIRRGMRGEPMPWENK